MPNLRNGRVLAGVGGGKANVSINGEVPQILRTLWGGGACDLDGDAIVFNGSPDNQTWDVFRYRPSTGVLDSARAAAGFSAPRGANVLGAGGGAWAARGDRYFDSLGRLEQAWGIWQGSVTERGRIIAHTNPYSPSAIGDLIALEANGQPQIRVLAPNVVNPNRLLAKGDVVVSELGGTISILGAPPAVTARTFNLSSFAQKSDGTIWIVGYADVNGKEWLVAQPANDPANAILISDDRQNYRPDCEFQPDGTLWVVTAEDEAESPNRLRCWQFDLPLGKRRLVMVGQGVAQPWTTLSYTDLTAPGPTPPTPVPPTPIPPVPVPPEVPVPDSLLPLLEAERAKYGATMTNDQCVELLNAVAFKGGNGWGLHRKDGGNLGTRHDGATCAVDWLVHGPTNLGLDCIRDAGGVSEVGWGDLEPAAQGVFVAAIAPQGTPTPPPQPPPTPVPPPPPPPVPSPCDLGPVLDKLGIVLAQNVDLVAAVTLLSRDVQTLQSQVSGLRIELNEIKARQDRALVGRMTGWLGGDITLVPRS